MNVYDADHLRNVALVGHQGSGKTMLAEAMLHDSGGLDRLGSIEEGTTASDYHDSEKERQMSIFTSLLHAEWKDYKINILDTPGYPDFASEVISALKVADTAIYVMNAVEGVQVGTELAWRYGEQTQKPSMFVINHLDQAASDFRVLVDQIEERFGRAATVVQLPGGEGTRSIIDVLLMKQVTFPEGADEPQISEIDDAFREEAEELHNELVEDIAENDEELMELYFEQGTLSEEQMRDGLHDAMLRRELFPIFLTSATENIGVGRLMSFIDNVCPSPAEMPPAAVEEGTPPEADPEGEPVAFIWRTMAEQHVGDFSFFRVYSGSVSQGQDLENAQTGTTERLGPIYGLNGRERDGVKRMVAGDIGAVVKLKDTHTNDTLHAKGRNVRITPIEFPEPRYRAAVRAKREGEESKLAEGLHQLVEEDPSLRTRHDQNLNQLILEGQGALHLEIAKYRLEHQFGVEVELQRPKVSYREMVLREGRADYRHKKQSGGAGQFADISMLVQPLDGRYDVPDDVTVRGEEVVETDWGATVEFIDGIVGGVIDMRRFFSAIQKGVVEAMEKGPLAGYPVGDIRVIIYDGGMHPVDSNEAAFKAAGRGCFRKAFQNASPVMLEPVHEVEVTVPETYVGDVMGDLNTRRAQIQGIKMDGVFQKIEAYVPEAEMHKYATRLRSLTQGRGLHQTRFDRYEQMPRNVQDEVVEGAQAVS